jgi:hypothetical protein
MTRCRGCGEEMAWVMRDWRTIPFCIKHQQNHFICCPERARFHDGGDHSPKPLPKQQTTLEVHE